MPRPLSRVTLSTRTTLPRGRVDAMRYQIVAETYRDLEAASGRLELIRLLAGLVGQTPDELVPTVALLCQGQIAPDFAGVELGMAERLAAGAVAQVAGMAVEQVLAGARDTGTATTPTRPRRPWPRCWGPGRWTPAAAG